MWPVSHDGLCTWLYPMRVAYLLGPFMKLQALFRIALASLVTIPAVAAADWLRASRKTVVIFTLCGLLAACGTSGTMPPIRLQVVEDASGAPVPQANVFFYAYAEEGTLTGHGGRNRNLFLIEGITDLNGVVNFPAQKFNAPPTFTWNLDGPSLLAYKPGYYLGSIDGAHFTHVEEIIKRGGRLHEMRLVKAPTAEREVAALDDAIYQTHLAYRHKGRCEWKKMAHTLATIEAEIRKWKSLAEKGNMPKEMAERFRWMEYPSSQTDQRCGDADAAQ